MIFIFVTAVTRFRRRQTAVHGVGRASCSSHGQMSPRRDLGGAAGRRAARPALRGPQRCTDEPPRWKACGGVPRGLPAMSEKCLRPVRCRDSENTHCTECGLRFSMEICGIKREKTVFNESLPKVTDIWLKLLDRGEHLQKPSRVHGELYSRNPVLQFPLRYGVTSLTWPYIRPAYRKPVHMLYQEFT